MRIAQSFRGHKEVAAFSLNAVRARRECEKDEGMVRLVPDIRGSDSGAAGLLIECRGQSPAMLQVGLLGWGFSGFPWRTATPDVCGTPASVIIVHRGLHHIHAQLWWSCTRPMVGRYRTS